jgi:hypothetical protein
MITSLNQRWRARRHSYRPAGEVIRTADYDVAPIEEDSIAKRFVVEHHYSASYPAARYRYGLYRRTELVGVAVFSHPASDRVLSIFPGSPRESVELGRFVLLDDVAGNGETWFLARAFELLRREQLIGVVSFSDPMPRQTTDGRVVHAGHVGTIYQAFNACFLGSSKARGLRLLPDGQILHDRALQKIRTGDKGWRYSAALLEAHGAPPLAGSSGAKVWLDEWIPRLTRRVLHPGNFKYAWMLDRRHRRHLPESKQYPKVSLPACAAAMPSAEGRVTGKCGKCDGTGRIRAFMHLTNGRCFSCAGAGTLEVAPAETPARRQSPAWRSWPREKWIMCMNESVVSMRNARTQGWDWYAPEDDGTSHPAAFKWKLVNCPHRDVAERARLAAVLLGFTIDEDSMKGAG